MTTPVGVAETSLSQADASPGMIRDHLRGPLQEYFRIPADEMPTRLSRLLVDFEAALRDRGSAVTVEFREGLMRALPALRTFALSLTGDASRADDLVQETMMRAWINHHRFEPGTRLIAWLFTIQRNLFYSERRKRKREVEDADGIHAENLIALADQEDTIELKNLYEKLERLSPTQRQALLLVGAEGFTYEEAAVLLNCRVGTVKSRVSRARTELSDLLGTEWKARRSGEKYGSSLELPA